MSGANSQKPHDVPVPTVMNSPAPASQLQTALTIQDRMQADARQAVMSSGHWLGVAEVATLARCTQAEASAQTIQWERAGRIFAIETEQGHLFPDYGFDPDNGYRPRASLKRVLDVFCGSETAWGMAYWFMSINSYLGGRRPQDVLLADPDRVVLAARDEIQGVLHG